MGLPRGYISSTEQKSDQNKNGMSPRQSRKKSSAEDLLQIIVIYCDYE
jgi:hypothetical protein